MQIILWLVALAIFSFWLWMFWDMSANETLSKCYITITKDPKLDWMLAFVFLNILTAGLYFFTEFKH